MARSNKKRYDDTINYIDQNISSDLALTVGAALIARTADDIGSDLSLKGAKFYKHGSDNQHWAVRSLLLCQQAFLNAPYARSATGGDYTYNLLPDATKPFYLLKTEDEVKRAIRAYIPIHGASRTAVADAGENIAVGEGLMVWETFTRDTSPYPKLPVCFDALKMWLFKAGFVSLRWLASTGPTMSAYSVNNILGQGVKIQPNQIANIPRGYLFNFHAKKSQAVCHWGVSLGGGLAAGANTQADWDTAPPNIKVDFRDGGNSFYGKFTMESSYQVCQYKYADKGKEGQAANVVVRQIDPEAVTTYF